MTLDTGVITNFHAATVTVTCEDYEFTSKQCDEDLACLFAPPTEDPLYDVARLIG